MGDDCNREVNYAKYCKECKYEDISEVKDPCDECLGESMRINTEKPVNFKEKEK